MVIGELDAVELLTVAVQMGDAAAGLLEHLLAEAVIVARPLFPNETRFVVLVDDNEVHRRALVHGRIGINRLRPTRRVMGFDFFVELPDDFHELVDFGLLEVVVISSAGDVNCAGIAFEHRGGQGQHDGVPHVERHQEFTVIDAAFEVARFPALLGTDGLALGHGAPGGTVLGVYAAVVAFQHRLGQMGRLGDLQTTTRHSGDHNSLRKGYDFTEIVQEVSHRYLVSN